MINRRKFSISRRSNNINNNNNKARNDDDNCSVVCYKDLDDDHVGVVRIRQQPVCSACNTTRGTLSLYYKHILESNHRENVKKLCNENRFVPSVYDQAIHLAFYNNFFYQSDKFHFRYKHTNEEPNATLGQIDSSTILNQSEKDRNEINNNNQQKTTPTNVRKRRNLHVTLIFQDKTYSQIGTTMAQIREQLLKEMIADRANDITALPMDIYYIKKKIVPDNIHHNAQKSSVILTMVKDQSQIMLKKQQQQQEPFDDGSTSSAKNSNEDNSVEQNITMTTREISKTEKIDIDEQPSFVDDIINICKDVLNQMTIDIYSQCGELKREQQFLAGIARRSFKKKNTFFCDICSIFLTSEKYCTQHLNGIDHLEKLRHYQTTFLSWRKAMQQSLITGVSMKEIMGTDDYGHYKTTMAFYLAPNTLSNRGRFCCAYCELVFTDQWSLERHLNTVEHKNKQSSSDHKDLVVHLSNVIILPSIFKFNGITQLSEIPDDIKTRYQWRCTTHTQLDDDTASFIRNYPFDVFEGVTHIVNSKSAKKHKSSAAKSSKKNSRNSSATSRYQQKRRTSFKHRRGRQFQNATTHRRTGTKRPFPLTDPSNKRLRTDFNNSFPRASRTSESMRNYQRDQYNYDRSASFTNNNNRWSFRYPGDQQREAFFQRSTIESRSFAFHNNGYYDDRPSRIMQRGNNYDHERQLRFNNTNEQYDNRQSNYDPNFIRAVAKVVAEYHPESSSSLLAGSPHRHSNAGPTDEFIYQVANNLQRSQCQQSRAPMMTQEHYQNRGSFGAFGNNPDNNKHSPFFPSAGNQQQQSQMGSNDPPIRSYADYRASSRPPIVNTPLSMGPPFTNIPNPIGSQSRTFDELGHSPLMHSPSNTYGRPRESIYGSNELYYNNFRRQNEVESLMEPSWYESSRRGNCVRGRGHTSAHFQSSNKQAGASFSHSRVNKNNNNSSMRGRNIAGRNTRNFGSRR